MADTDTKTSDDIPIREPEVIRQDCTRKVRAVQVSDHFQAILGCLLCESWATPRLVEMVIRPDGHLLGRFDGERSIKAFLGASEDLIKNIHGVAPVAELDGDEIGYVVGKVGRDQMAEVILFGNVPIDTCNQRTRSRLHA